MDPFTTANVDLYGDVRLCSCSVWMPTTVGNIKENTIEEILNSELASDIRQSIRNGTYEYCNESTCGIINNNRLLEEKDIVRDDGNDNAKSTYDRVFDTEVVEPPRQITLSGDLICNLSCPSCRSSVITETDEEKHDRAGIISNINKNLFSGKDDRWVTIYLSLGGELFASPLMLDFIKDFPVDRYPKAEFKIQSNGLLIKKRWDRIKHLEKNIFNITITADSQDSDTYKKLRRGGQFSTLVENLEFLAQLKKELGFQLVLRMVLQKDNASEIEQFFNFAMKYEADSVEYQFLQNRGTFSDVEFRELNVLNPEHELHNQIVEDLRRLKSKYQSKVVIYHGSI
jgi:MoaA/NifB/PqqE/SkfB family radical SAM enzyme